jgi:hypothetical protein
MEPVSLSLAITHRPRLETLHGITGIWAIRLLNEPLVITWPLRDMVLIDPAISTIGSTTTMNPFRTDQLPSRHEDHTTTVTTNTVRAVCEVAWPTAAARSIRNRHPTE